MSDESSAEPADGLWSRLRLIEGQPLQSRAEAYSALHDELSRRLESAPRDDQGSRARDASEPG
ncbi:MULTISPECIES: hypothetical protein [Microbacterium]|uniref:Uncharacterized protein n=1 Tax=Microbacterium resistens TaxID=156977 RepID=A0ABY3RX55_9MICO|nr:hypothetical protein [Microbacterium resistens]MBW1640211.1 hypothetical protein [Microbacterium resistens]MDA4895684.1 hypothetical protein [Streptomyces sp. MS2A]UGS26992.1 hypothetical protein K8F61_01880 [Microbacterium resistens]